MKQDIIFFTWHYVKVFSDMGFYINIKYIVILFNKQILSNLISSNIVSLSFGKHSIVFYLNIKYSIFIVCD